MKQFIKEKNDQQIWKEGNLHNNLKIQFALFYLWEWQKTIKEVVNIYIMKVLLTKDHQQGVVWRNVYSKTKI